MNTKGNRNNGNFKTNIYQKEEINMSKINGRYTEVSIESTIVNNDGRNPLRKRFQYEYALYMLISSMFQSVRCRSRNIDSLRLYYIELPDKAGKKAKDSEEENKTRTKADVVLEIANLIVRDIAGKIPFPKMHKCAVESRAVLEEDGSHTFIFTDGVYSFSVHLDMYRNRELKKIRIADLRSSKDHTAPAVVKKEEKAALKSVA